MKLLDVEVLNLLVEKVHEPRGGGSLRSFKGGSPSWVTTTLSLGFGEHLEGLLDGNLRVGVRSPYLVIL